MKTEKGAPIHAASEIKPWQALTLEFADGEVKVREDSPKQGRLL